jgi:hypothetical protein
LRIGDPDLRRNPDLLAWTNNRCHPVWEEGVKRWILILLGMLVGAGVTGLTPVTLHAAQPATLQKPQISAEAMMALQRMGKTLRAEQFSFEAQTIRVYAGPKGEPLHIFHALAVTVQRPNRLLVVRNGDDGQSRLVYDGKTLFLYIADGNKYAAIPVPGTIEGMMREAMGRLGIDFPLADFLSNEPDKSFLSGVTQGEVANTVSINGTPCLHMFFAQPPGIELELWVEDNEQALPLRLIVTYRALPGEPNFVATFSNWNFAIHPATTDFVFQPPPGAIKMAFGPPAAAKGGTAGGAK